MRVGLVILSFEFWIDTRDKYRPVASKSISLEINQFGLMYYEVEYKM